MDRIISSHLIGGSLICKSELIFQLRIDALHNFTQWLDLIGIIFFPLPKNTNITFILLYRAENNQYPNIWTHHDAKNLSDISLILKNDEERQRSKGSKKSRPRDTKRWINSISLSLSIKRPQCRYSLLPATRCHDDKLVVRFWKKLITVCYPMFPYLG